MNQSEDICFDLNEFTLQKVINKLYEERGFDFRDYKQSTIRRRLVKRLTSIGIPNVMEYIDYLDGNPGEYDVLMSELTINVTSFFRDATTFNFLKDRIIPGILSRKSKSGLYLRFWSAGCASGEETYSLAIILHELLGNKSNNFEIAIYGTDIDRASINKAIKAVYDESNLTSFDSVLRAKYFSPYNRKYKISPDIRSMVKFTTHDLVTGFAYSNFDLIMCRNVLIYFDKKRQAQLLRKFHRGLADKGILVLGKSEVLPKELNRFFTCLNRNAKIYQKQNLGEEDIQTTE